MSDLATAKALASSSNKRRYERQPVTHGGTLLVAELGEFPCELRDACPGGVFVIPPEYDDRWRDLIDSDKVQEVVLLIRVPEWPDPCRLRGKIAHRSAQGLGIACHEDIPASLLQALQSGREIPARRSTSPKHKAIHADSLNALARWLPGMLAQFFDELATALDAAAENALTNQERYTCLEAMSDLQKRRAELSVELTERLKEQAEVFAEPTRILGDKDPASTELTLVDTVEFEDWLALHTAIMKLETEWRNALEACHQRLSLIAGKRIYWQNNPFGPWMFGQAVRNCLATLDLQPFIRHLAYHAFAKALQPSLGVLYDQLDQTLLPLRAELPTPRPAVPYSPPAIEEEPHDRVNVEPPSTSESPAPQITAPVSSTPPPAPAPGVLATARTLWDIQQSLQFTHQDGVSEEQTAADTHRPAVGDTQFDRPFATDNADSLFDTFFQSMLQERAVPTQLRSYLGQLQAPLAALAKVDPKFLEQDQHPAREFVNQLDHLALATDSKGEIENPALAAGVAKILQKVLSDAEQQPEAAFAEAQEQLNQLTLPLLRKRATRWQRLQQTCEANQRLEFARRTVNQAITKRFHGRKVPSVLTRLINAGWRQLLVLTVLREGLNSVPWRRHWGVLELLTKWLAPDMQSANINPKEAHLLINHIEEQLWTLGEQPANQLKALVGELTALLIGSGPDGSRRAPDYETFEDGSEVSATDAAISDSDRELIGRLQVGDWLAFAGTNGDWLPQRLTWKGQETPLFVFTDPRGQKTHEIVPGDLAGMFRESRVQSMASLDLPWLDRTTNEFMQTIQNRLRHQATHDAVTGLVNRKEFVRQLERRLKPQGAPPLRLMLCLLEVDLLRVINNLCGIEAGDSLLREIAQAMTGRLNSSDVLARMGDSHFGVLFSDCDERHGMERAKALLSLIQGYRFNSGDHAFTLGADIGLINCDDFRDSAHILLQHADAACMTARQRGRNQIQLYREHDAAVGTHVSLMSWAGQIDKFMTENRLFVRAQPIMPLFPDREAHSHHEILLGVRGETGVSVPPTEFVRAAEHWKRMPDIDAWQIKSVFAWIRQNRRRFDSMGGFAINLSGQSINSPEFLASLQNTLLGADWPTEKITFEITETEALDDFGQAQKFIRQIKRLGSRFSLDDFGSGFSSYAYLKNLNVDYLKIDGSFVKDILSSATDLVMVKSMNEIGHSLNMKTIAEYVENGDIAEKLKEVGVDFAQGYGIGKPVPIEQLA